MSINQYDVARCDVCGKQVILQAEAVKGYRYLRHTKDFDMTQYEKDSTIDSSKWTYGPMNTLIVPTYKTEIEGISTRGANFDEVFGGNVDVVETVSATTKHVCGDCLEKFGQEYIDALDNVYEIAEKNGLL